VAEKPHCYVCNQELTFDPKQVGKISGRMIPLDPHTKKPHNCPGPPEGEEEQEQQQEELKEDTPQEPQQSKAVPAVARQSKARLVILGSSDRHAVMSQYNQIADWVYQLNGYLRWQFQSFALGDEVRYSLAIHIELPSDKVEEFQKLREG
jgi:hypothetical protein